jgi:hypothetical protein
MQLTSGVGRLRACSVFLLNTDHRFDMCMSGILQIVDNVQHNIRIINQPLSQAL